MISYARYGTVYTHISIKAKENKQRGRERVGEGSNVSSRYNVESWLTILSVCMWSKIHLTHAQIRCAHTHTAYTRTQHTHVIVADRKAFLICVF